jgi:Methyltransferase domain
VTRPKLVVDLGSGTGLSARVWGDRAEAVVGIEPNEAMRGFAEQATQMPNVRYLGTSAYETGLPDASADVLTAAQSLQWIKPERLFPELERILRTGGVFCAYNYSVLQTPLWEPETVFVAVLARKRKLRVETGSIESRRPIPLAPHCSKLVGSSARRGSCSCTASKAVTVNGLWDLRSARGACERCSMQASARRTSVSIASAPWIRLSRSRSRGGLATALGSGCARTARRSRSSSVCAGRTVAGGSRALWRLCSHGTGNGAHRGAAH